MEDLWHLILIIFYLGVPSLFMDVDPISYIIFELSGMFLAAVAILYGDIPGTIILTVIWLTLDLLILYADTGLTTRRR
jgi:hypothetical protein